MRVKFILLALLILGATPLLVGPEASAKEAPKKYVALGDSITAGVDVAPGRVTPFVDQYESMLEANGDEYKVVNLGVPGWTSTDLLHALHDDERFRRNVRSADRITLHIGTNDMLVAWRRYAFDKPRSCGGSRCVNRAVKTFAKRYAGTLRTISKLRGGDMRGVRTATLYRPHVADDKRRGDFRALKPHYHAMNRRLTAIAKRHGVRVRDAGAAFNGRRGRGDAVKRGMVLARPDGVHPTGKGHQALARAMR